MPYIVVTYVVVVPYVVVVVPYTVVVVPYAIVVVSVCCCLTGHQPVTHCLPAVLVVLHLFSNTR